MDPLWWYSTTNDNQRKWYSDREEANSRPVKTSQLDDFCSANNSLQDDGKGVDEQGELQGSSGSERSKLSNSISNRPMSKSFDGQSFFFRWSCNHFQGNKVVDVWSNHAYPRLSGGSVNSFCPGLRKCTPRQRQMAHRVHEPAFDASVISKATKDQSAQFVWLSLDWARNSPYIDKARVRGSCWTFIPKGQSSYQC